MDLILCWFIAPIGLLATAVGLSFGVERSTGLTLPWTVRPAMGMAAMIVIAQFGTATEFTAKLTLPLILVLAVLGLLLGRRLATPMPSGVMLAIAAGLFILFASPFLVSGEATWAGYIKLDDNATWLAITNHVFEHGRAVGNEPPSTHQQVLQDYLGGSYPIGAFVPMAVMTELTGQDLAFTLQPSMAVAAVLLALILFELSRSLGRGVGASALIAVVAPLSALLLGYYLWGGVKELVMAALLPLGPVLAGLADREDWPKGAFVSIAVTIAAIIAVLGPGGRPLGGAAAHPRAHRPHPEVRALGLGKTHRRTGRRSRPAPSASCDLHPDRDLQPARRRRHRRSRDRQPTPSPQPAPGGRNLALAGLSDLA